MVIKGDLRSLESDSFKIVTRLGGTSDREDNKFEKTAACLQ